MQLNQINMAYEPDEDRIKLRISSLEQEEFVFILTRRFAKLLLTVFNKYFSEEQAKMPPSISPQAKQSVTQFEHEKAVQDADFKQPYKPAKQAITKPQNEILLYKIQMKPKDADNVALGLYPKSNQGLELNLNNQFMHTLYHLLIKVLEKTDWELDTAIRITDSTQVDDKSKLH